MTEATPRMTQDPLKILPGRHPERPKIDPSTLPEHPRAKKNHLLAHSWPKSRESRPKVGPKRPVWDPSWTPKSTKKRHRAKKELPKMAPEAVFIDFLDHLRSKSHSKSIWGGSEPSKSYYFYSGSTIFTKSRFSQFPRILTPNGTPNPRIFTKNARGETPKSPK